MEKINKLGTFADMSAVWAKHPEGGRDGDYITIGTVVYYWSDLARQWIAAGSDDSSNPTSQTIEGDLNVGGDLDVAGSAHIGGDVTIDGVLNVSRINFTDPLPEPHDGQSIFKSIVFKRAASRQAAMTPALTSDDGTFYNPVPTDKGWSDGIPSGTAPIWMACRIFTNDAQPPQGNWSRPELMSDTESFDVEFSDSYNKPAAPNGANQNGGSGEQVWFDPVLDASAFSTRTMRWMATRTRITTSNGPDWGPWSVILIVGEPGEDGFGVEMAYTVYRKDAAPAIYKRNGALPLSYNCTWQIGTSGLRVGANQALWMSQRTYSSNVYGLWGDAVRISGDGAPGEDGADFEMIFKQMDRLPTSDDAAPTNMVNQDDYVPESEGWYDEAKGVDMDHKCEWACMRQKSRGSSVWGDWIGPFAWSVYGDTGMDGSSVQYVFKRTTAEESAPARPTVTSDGYTNEQGEYIPRGWSDDPLGVNSYYIKEWVSIRRKGERQQSWGDFSEPALWATYSESHTVVIGENGNWWIDGRDTGVKAEGENGTGVALKGVVDFKSTSDAGYTSGKTTLQEVTGMEVGDCYVVSSNGYLYVYNGGSTWPNNWTELGAFRGTQGEDGVSHYIHIAWSYNIDFDGDVPVGTIYTDYANLPISQYGYPEWQGFAVTSSDPNSENYNATGQDPEQASAYKWNHVRGKDGSDFERVYIRTKNNIRPKAAAKINNNDGYLPLCTNNLDCRPEGTIVGVETIYRFSDNPKGPIPDYPYEWMAERKKQDGVWGEFGDSERQASLWSIYSKPPTITVDPYGYWLIDGNKIPDGQGGYVRAQGEPGQGIEMKGFFENEAERLAYDTSGLRAGDCFYQEDTGHLWMWNGSGWQNIGEIKGQAGESQYLHIAWATNVRIQGNTIQAVEGFSMTSGTGYNWVGFLASADEVIYPGNTDTDPIKLSFKWNYIKGMDGDQFEYVYIRTTTNSNPGVKKREYPSNYVDSRGHHPSEDEFLPADGSGLDANNHAINEYTDDPNGVDDVNQFEWECCRRKTAGTWGLWSDPYLVHNWGNDGKGIEIMQDRYMLSMMSKGVTLNNTIAADWGTEYLEPTAELPYLWHYTYIKYTDGDEYTSPCELIATYSARSGENLLNDTDFLSLEAMTAWRYKGELSGSGNIPEPVVHEVEVVEGVNGHNAFSVSYQGSSEVGLIIFLSQVIYSESVKKIKPDNWYTLSFWMKGTSDTLGDTVSSSKPCRLDISSLNRYMDTDSGVKMYVDGEEKPASTSVSFKPAADGSWTYHTFTFKTKSTLSLSSSSDAMMFAINMYTRLTLDNFQVCMPKLELGRMATPYDQQADSVKIPMRTSVWAPGVKYLQGAPGEQYFDVVSFGGSWYRCKRSHTSSASLTPSNPTFWEAAEDFNLLSTNVLLAENGAINLLSSNVINLFNGVVKTASINADGHGSYCIYYSNGRKMMELSYEGYIYYYHNTQQNNVAWQLGYGGTIIKQGTTDDWVQLNMYPITFPGSDTPSVTPTLNASLPINVDGTTRHPLTAYYKFVAGSNSQYTFYDGMIFTTGTNESPQTKINNGYLIPDGWYNTTEYGYLNIDSNVYALTVKRIVNGRVVETREITQYYQ